MNVTLSAAADAVWDAGDRFGRLAEEHHLQALHKEQQADPLVLAGTTLKSHSETHVLLWSECVAVNDGSFFPAGGERDGQREKNPSTSVCHRNLSAASGRFQ